MQLNNKKILITGGGGLIGSYIVDQLLAKQVKHIIVVENWIRGSKKNIELALKSKKVEIVEGDIQDQKLIDKVMNDIDIVFHQAALKHNQCTQNPRFGHEVLADGTFTVFESAAKNNIKKVIFASSASVYGNPKHLPMKETYPFNDTTIYGAAKIYNERIAYAFHALYKLPFVGLRYFNVYGPRMDIHGAYTEVLIRWLDQIKNGSSPIIYGSGKQSMDFVYVEDVADANILAAEGDIETGIFNVGTGVETTLLELLSLILKLTSSNLKPIFKPARAHSLANRRQADIELVKEKLKFKAKTSLEVGLKKLIKWYNLDEKRI